VASPPEKKSPALGIFGLLLVVICAVVWTVVGYLLFKDLFAMYGSNYAPTNVDVNSLTAGQRTMATGLGVAMIGGVAGWVISIVATATNKGRGLGIAGIVLGVIAPFLIVISIAIAAAAYA